MPLSPYPNVPMTQLDMQRAQSGQTAAMPRDTSFFGQAAPQVQQSAMQQNTQYAAPQPTQQQAQQQYAAQQAQAMRQPSPEQLNAMRTNPQQMAALNAQTRQAILAQGGVVQQASPLPLGNAPAQTAPGMNANPMARQMAAPQAAFNRQPQPGQQVTMGQMDRMRAQSGQLGSMPAGSPAAPMTQQQAQSRYAQQAAMQARPQGLLRRAAGLGQGARPAQPATRVPTMRGPQAV